MQSLYVVTVFVQISDPELGYLEPKKQKLYHIGISSLTRKAP